MTATFSHPPHPVERKLAESTDQAPTEEKSKLDGQPERDPHALPSFELKEHKVPVLYLPPLLSALPERVPPVEVQTPADSSPLTTETRLPDIDPASLSLHKSLHHFQPITSDYAEVPYEDGFNWSELRLPEDEEREWYCVAFKSQRKAGSNGDSLYEADKLAHEEAVCNGGLIMYWYGIPNPQTGMNLATCIWQSRKHAAAANSRPHHINAMRLAAQSYEVYALSRYRLRKVKGETGVTVEEYTGGDVGW
ncbi:hypothetical protein FA15DRAFT_589948 [Coprinopsis marcescibilis]|uniref:Uncharacterized protein n=1 Tax=Coprinopsis marcescibilis TaxID=230819 RepID=A0A5C3KYJ0_COPMA|nr:hypothetical protein FA15DRAFT_589948 [Coprinopsis marcescibilis]